jgi:hypothetical protein
MMSLAKTRRITEWRFYMATIRQRKSGTYEIKVSCGYDVNGKQVLQFKR